MNEIIVPLYAFLTLREDIVSGPAKVFLNNLPLGEDPIAFLKTQTALDCSAAWPHGEFVGTADGMYLVFNTGISYQTTMREVYADQGTNIMVQFSFQIAEHWGE